MADPVLTGPGETEQLHLLAEALVLELAPVEQVLSEAARAAASTAGYSCGITYIARYGVITVASSDDAALAVDELQYAGGDGPCLQAMRTGVPVEVRDVLQESRWGSYPALAARAGIRSSISHPLVVAGQSVGALNLYSAEPGPWPPDQQATARLISLQAAGVLQAVRRIAADLLADSRTAGALQTRHDVDVATGLVMAEHGCSAEDAHARIKAESVRAGLAIGIVAKAVLDAGELGSNPCR